MIVAKRWTGIVSSRCGSRWVSYVALKQLPLIIYERAVYTHSGLRLYDIQFIQSVFQTYVTLCHFGRVQIFKKQILS